MRAVATRVLKALLRTPHNVIPILSFTIVTIIIIILAMLGLRCCPQTLSICSKWGLLSCCGAWEPGRKGSVVVPPTFY